jgi:exopolysaccharide biosynthesis polyprenyl glycosylphosphotransferase
MLLLILLPFWVVIFAILGLYNERYYQNRFSEFARVGIGSFIGILFAISYSYMVNVPFFPARLVVIYGYLLTVLAVILFRTVARDVQRHLFNYGIGLNNVLLVGDTKITLSLIENLGNSDLTGYEIVGVVGGIKHKIEQNKHIKLYGEFSEAIRNIKSRQLHTIIQTELYPSVERNDEILTYAQSNHVAYRFVPGNSELFVGNIKVDLLQTTPIIAVHQTALVGWGGVLKRLNDILLGSLFLLLTSPILLVIIIVQFISSPKSPIFYKATRLTRFGDKVSIYKFRTLIDEYNAMSPEDAFTKMGKPELIKKYRDNGDQLAKDPRISRFGRFMRLYSLDELPQLVNIIKGDISLVGPRALDDFELEQYSKKNLILAVKSGLTGLAQISGRDDISFEERRQLDLYYVQNWTFWGDIVIMIKTIWVVLHHRGAN